MRVNPRIIGVGAATFAATLALTGCSSDSVEETSASYCEALAALEAELDTLTTLVASDATVEEVTDQKDKVADAYDAVRSSGEDLTESVKDAASGAYDSFENAVGDIPSDIALSEAAGDYAAATESFLADLGTIATDAGCE